MQLNISTCYAIQIMLYLTRNNRIVSSTELSENMHISQRYIIKISGKLRDDGLINARAGMSGGYIMSKDPSTVSIYDIVTLMEGDMSIPDCAELLPGSDLPCKNTNLLDTLNVMKDYLDTYIPESNHLR